jgi:hypothetical protein
MEDLDPVRLGVLARGRVVLEPILEVLGRLGDPKGDVSGDAKWVDTAFEEIFAKPGFERQARASRGSSSCFRRGTASSLAPLNCPRNRPRCLSPRHGSARRWSSYRND